MKLNTKMSLKSIENDLLKLKFLKSGDIYQITSQNTQINLLNANLLDGSVSNIYLRKKEKGIYFFSPLLGINSASSFKIKNNKAYYVGKTLDVNYQVVLSLKGDTWYYDVFIEKNNNNKQYDLYYGQDVALADMNMVSNNELYTSQYVDHKVFNTDNGYVVLSKQNQGNSNILQIGSFNKISSYSTDGFQFFGNFYKLANTPKALYKAELENKNYQYEFSYVAVKTKPFTLKDNNKTTFYAKFIKDNDQLVKKPFPVTKYNQLKDENQTGYEKLVSKIKLGAPIVGNTLKKEELLNSYPNMLYLEEQNQQILSFFTDNHRHIITKEKELLVERPHAHIMIHGNILKASEEVMAASSFMFGVFSSHVVLGNTSFHKLSSHVRNMLNVQKIGGMRIYLKENDSYRLLTLPSLFEIAPNSLKWIYKLADDTIVVTYSSLVDKLRQKLTFQSLAGKKYDFLITNKITFAEKENIYPLSFKKTANEIEFNALKNPFINDKYPDLKYKYILSENAVITDDSIFFGADAQDGILVFSYENTNKATIDLIATINKNYDPFVNFNYQETKEKAYLFYRSLIPLNITTDNLLLESFNDLSFWYTHNALVHYASPHGIEQNSGAAWGTRDICQGPFEFFLTAQKYDVARNILLKVFQRQFYETGDFPQWFMFDKYYQIQAHDSHADIIIWPLKALATYLSVTSDTSILNEQLSYMSLEKNDFTTEKYSLYHHLKKILKRLKQTHIKGTNLPAYGGGDWNDTLQPANHDLTFKMASTWTVSLLYGALTNLSKVIKGDKNLAKEIKSYQKSLKTDYFNHLVVDDIPTGFTIFSNNEKSFLIHPRDTKTNLKYRLLSFTRGIISELFSKNKIKLYLDIIKNELKHPDGVRLMNDAITYSGGKTTYFQRAETAANFGREIGLNYIHAHIRYIEAVAKLGLANDVIKGLNVVNPIILHLCVKNALYRQRNTYFSSSDGNFYDRYLAKEYFYKLKTGDVKVKAGWRIYSSGPGILLNQLISNTFGIKIRNKNLVFRPLLAKQFAGLVIDYTYLGRPLTIAFHLANKTAVYINKEKIKIKTKKNKYKSPSFIIDKSDLKAEKITIDFYYQTKDY